MINKFQFIIIFFIFLTLLIVHDQYAADKASDYISKMTLEEKIGQIMFIGFQGNSLNSKNMNHLKKINPGGIVFYRRNFEDASDIPSLISIIKSITKNHYLPLFFAIDQEGGIVHRIKGEYYKPPSVPAIGAINSAEITREVGLSVGNALRDLGININFAPVLDVPIDLLSSPMSRRSFSDNPKTVARLGTAYIKGLQDAGMLSTAKHFPGMGRTHEDSHHTLPRIIWETQDEKDSDIMPFKEAIKTGVDMIMVGHVVATPGDLENPISLSSYWMTDVLRNDLEFKGLVLVDNIEMKPIKNIMSISEASVKSFNAGADIIMVSHKRKTQKEVFNALMKAVLNGDISHQRLNESVRRIIKAKKKILSHKTKYVSSKNLKELSRLVAENSVIVLSLKGVPFTTINKNDKVLYVGNNRTIFITIKDTFENTEILNTSLSNYEKIYPETPLEEFIRKFDALLIDASYNDAPHITSLCKGLNKKYFVLQNYFTDIYKTIEKLSPKHIVITYENNRENLKVVFEIVSGLRQAKGRFPAHITFPPNYRYTSSKDTM